MTPSNLILHWFNRLWVGHPDFSNHGLPNGFGFPKNLTPRYPSKTPNRFWVLDVFFFFQIPHQTSSTDKKLQGTWIWSPTVVGRVGFGSLLRPLAGWPRWPRMDGLGWLGWLFQGGCRRFNLPLDLHPQKEWVGVCIGKWFSLKLFEGCDVNFWEFARKCRKQVKGFLSLLSCSCNFLHCKSISMTDLPVICS